MSFTSGGDITGEYKHTLSLNEMPYHNHWLLDQEDGTGASNSLSGNSNSDTPYSMVQRVNRDKKYWWSSTLGNGGSQSHNNISPCIVVYFWKRIS